MNLGWHLARQVPYLPYYNSRTLRLFSIDASRWALPPHSAVGSLTSGQGREEQRMHEGRGTRTQKWGHSLILPLPLLLTPVPTPSRPLTPVTVSMISIHPNLHHAQSLGSPPSGTRTSHSFTFIFPRSLYFGRLSTERSQPQVSAPPTSEQESPSPYSPGTPPPRIIPQLPV